MSDGTTELQERLQAALGDTFRVDREIHGGGMSRLFLATEASLSRHVVVKVLPPEFTSDVSAARFKQEMEFAARLQHPHILPILSAGAREGLLYYIMPYVAGESLRARLDREGALPVPDAIRLLHEVADALAFAHGEGVIHRDIKPENILLEGRHAVLADFGIARALLEARAGERLTATGLTVGTPGYMSPEQIAGGGGLDLRTDLYSLAIVGYEMLAGAQPFGGGTPQAVLAANLTQTPRPLRDVRPEVPEPVSAILDRSLSKDPADRPGSAAEFADQLAGAIQVAGPRTEPERTSRRLRNGLLAAGVLILAALVIGRVASSRASMGELRSELAALADREQLDSVSLLLDEADMVLSHRALTALADRVAGFLTISTEPEGAVITLTRVGPIETFASRTGRTPGRTHLTAWPAVAGEYLLHVGWPTGDSLSLLTTVVAGDTARVVAIHPPDAESFREFVSVSAGPSLDGEVPADFLISRTEVTHAQFDRFVRGGGYRTESFWPETMRVGGRVLPREQALARFVDGSGLPGPRAWSGGHPPAGLGDHPVNGVSWYEARAYALWAEADLPSGPEWWRAALGDGSHPYPWGRDGATIDFRANFGFSGTSPVGHHPLGVSPFGAHDMAGNVREWLAEPGTRPDQHLVVGGSWSDPSYMFERSHAESFDADFGSEVIGFRLVKRPVVRPR